MLAKSSQLLTSFSKTAYISCCQVYREGEWSCEMFQSKYSRDVFRVQEDIVIWNGGKAGLG